MTSPNFSLELQHWTRGFFRVAGVDEAGRGAWAGPVTVAAVILPSTLAHSRFNDSKVLGAPERERLAHEVRCVAVAWCCFAGKAVTPAIRLTRSVKP